MVAEREASRVGWLRAQAGTVRVRTTLGAVLVVGVALVAGSIALVLALKTTLRENVRASAQSRAEGLAASYSPSASQRILPVADRDEQLVQVIDPAGKVVASSQNIRGRAPLARLRADQSATITVPVGAVHFVAVAAGAEPRSGRFTVIVALALTDVTESTRAVTGLLALGVPALLLVVGFTTWKVVGRALAPVEAIRIEVDEVSGDQLHRRVPAPRGRDEIARLAATMNRMLGRLEDSHLRQRRFVSDASHELRSPVATIRAHTEIALAHPDRTSIAELAETVLAEDLRVQALVEDLLLLSGADERTPATMARSVDLDDILFAEARRLRETTQLHVDTAAVSAGRVRGNAGLLRRVVRNLADNASRHATSRVAFGLRENDGRVELTVDDDGSGIPVPDRQRVFERFVRLDRARDREHGGAGLGLSIVAAVIADHGGSAIAIESPAGGARLLIHLPADQGVATSP